MTLPSLKKVTPTNAVIWISVFLVSFVAYDLHDDIKAVQSEVVSAHADANLHATSTDKVVTRRDVEMASELDYLRTLIDVARENCRSNARSKEQDDRCLYPRHIETGPGR